MGFSFEGNHGNNSHGSTSIKLTGWLLSSVASMREIPVAMIADKLVDAIYIL